MTVFLKWLPSQITLGCYVHFSQMLLLLSLNNNLPLSFGSLDNLSIAHALSLEVFPLKPLGDYGFTLLPLA